ncbi:hypothetical protein AB0958_19685 [Streptomyces sp. NPDC006655]|uniref:hypothetical protein n=1 Tax=Streptomyces sp. NPDC006655 TaxID=3156898 RepID=UPI00345265FE
MRNAPEQQDPADASFQATKALFELEKAGHLHRAERHTFGWVAVIRQGQPPVIMHSPAGVHQFIENHMQGRALSPVTP